ncbi:MAG: alanine racemase [Pseudomonadales bacterium]
MGSSSNPFQPAEVRLLVRPAKAHISLAALQANLAQVNKCAPNSKIAAVVKANAYGHGAEQCATALEATSNALAVACIDEALSLRSAGIKAPILLLEGHFNAAELELAAKNEFWLMTHNGEQVQQVLDFKGMRELTIWLKVDTGMHRLGLTPDEFPKAHAALTQAPHVAAPVVLATHFSSAEEPKVAVTSAQIDALAQLNRASSIPMSLANSAGILAHPTAHAEWVRPGIMLYGCSPLGQEHPQRSNTELNPVMSLRTEVIAVHDVAAGEGVGYGLKWRAGKPSKIATVAIGYGDGYPRSAPSGTPVLINGQRAPLCGTVSMDMITVDITELENVTIGSTAELWGKELLVDEVAAMANTISYELLTRMPARVVREYS